MEPTTNYAPVKVRAQKSNWSFGVDLLVCSKTHVADPVVLRPITEEERHIYRESTVNINEIHAQELMDDLWKIGIRPTNGEGNVGQIGAIKAHLEDMRKIAFAELQLKEDDANI